MSMSDSRSARRGATALKAGGADAMGLVIDYDQGKDQRWNRFPTTGLGVCFALSMFWVENTKAGKTLVAWLMPPLESCSKGGSAGGNDADIVNAVRDRMSEQSKLVDVTKTGYDGATET